MGKNRNLTRIFLIGSILFSFLLYFFIIKGLLGAQNLSFTPSNLATLHQNPIYFLIDSLVIILPLFAWLVGSFFEELVNSLRKKIKQEEGKQEKLSRITAYLNQGDVDFEEEVGSNNGVVQQLLSLRDNLKQQKKDEEIRKQEDNQRHWVAEGLAKFGDILRQNNDNIEKLSFEIISKLSNYIDAVQGGFYLFEDEDQNDLHYRLTAHFAYNRQKYNEKRIEWGEGLIGRAAFEKKTLLIDEVPGNYVEVTSGLGETNPDVLLIVPLIYNGEVHGVIELAGFNSFEKYKVDFVEKIAENIGSTISNVRINVRTAKLLKDSQEQAERLSQQEEEMRQNMEELQATQEEAAKQSKEFISFTNSVNHTLIRAEYDVNGILIYANTKFLRMLEYDKGSEVEGHHISMFINEKDKVWFNDIWNELSRGGQHFEGYMKHVTKKGKDLWTMATYTCVRNEEGGVEKVLFLAIDTTEHKKQSLDYEGQVSALNLANIKAEYAPSGKFIACNEKFLEAVDYSMDEVKETSIFDFFTDENQASFEELWNDVVNGKPYQGQLNVTVKDKKVKWFQMTFMSVNDMYGEVDKILVLAIDITDQKELEIRISEQNRTLKVQEERLKNAEVELQKRLDTAKRELRQHFKEVERSKVRHEKTLQGMLDGIVTINQNGIIEFFNKAAENLWGYDSKEVLGQNVKVLFSKEMIENNDFVNSFVSTTKDKFIGERKEVSIMPKNGEPAQILILLSDATVDKEHTYTAFIQQIEVELF
ncbi:MAG: PAS domain-containing protein [Salinivirgaceae bacterium]|jgi:PAS domain S-box-containing protein|nr:PAS domain-containing protein [Salinivirgaceae bacterium]